MGAFRPAGLLALASDFGAAGPYAGQMRGAALVAAPGVAVHDLWHGVPAQGVRAAAVLLPRLWRRFPPGTVHVAVVDPGVGTGRGALAVAWGGYLLVGPDNGLFTAALREGGEARALEPRHGLPPLSATFHGRDLFAPAGARLAMGLLRREELPRPERPPVLLELPGAVAVAGGWRGEVVLADPFGNLVTSIPQELLPPGPWHARIGEAVLPGRTTYAEAQPGELLALAGSFGLVELACRDGSAAARLGAGAGEPVAVGRGPAPPAAVPPVGG